MASDEEIDRNVTAFVAAVRDEDDEAAVMAASFLFATTIKALISIAASLEDLAETSRPS